MVWFQTRLRGYLVRHHVKDKKKAIVKLQSFFRRRFHLKVKCAIQIQRLWRGYRTRQRIHQFYTASSEVSSLKSISDIDGISVPDDLDDLFDTALLTKLESMQVSSSNNLTPGLNVSDSISETSVPVTQPTRPYHPHPQPHFVSSVGSSVGLEFLEKQRTELQTYADWLNQTRPRVKALLPPHPPHPSPPPSSVSLSPKPSPIHPSSSSTLPSPNATHSPLHPSSSSFLKEEYNYQWDLTQGLNHASSLSPKAMVPNSLFDSTTLFPPLPVSSLSSTLDPETMKKEARRIQHLIQHGTPLKQYVGSIGSPSTSFSSSNASFPSTKLLKAIKPKSTFQS